MTTPAQDNRAWEACDKLRDYLIRDGNTSGFNTAVPIIADAICQAVAEERERAAQVADRFADAQSVIGGSHGTGWRMAALAIAKAIRGGEAGD